MYVCELALLIIYMSCYFGYLSHAGFADVGDVVVTFVLPLELTNSFCRRITLGCAGLTIFRRLLQTPESWNGSIKGTRNDFPGAGTWSVEEPWMEELL